MSLQLPGGAHKQSPTPRVEPGPQLGHSEGVGLSLAPTLLSTTKKAAVESSQVSQGKQC